MTLTLLADTLGICRLAPDAAPPEWALRGLLWALTRTPDELSVVCTEALIPTGVRAERGWKALQVEGPLDFELTGVLARLATPLAEAGVPIFVVSTFDTDYLLVRGGRLEEALEALEAAGHRVQLA